MTVPKRWLDEDPGHRPDDFTRALLTGARAAAPSAEARARAAAALGVDAVAASTGGAPAATHGALAWGKGLALLTVGVAVVGGALLLRRDHRAPVTVATAAGPAPSPTAAATPAASTTLPAPPVQPAPGGAPGMAAPTPRATRPAAKQPHRDIAGAKAAAKTATDAAVPGGAPETAAPAQTRNGLREEVALISAAREAIAENAYRAALRVLDLHDRSFPSGVLAPEATALRVEALYGLADPTAPSLAARFLADHPDGPLADRVRTLQRRGPRSSGNEPRRP